MRMGMYMSMSVSLVVIMIIGLRYGSTGSRSRASRLFRIPW
jgi:hypothetical protein